MRRFLLSSVRCMAADDGGAGGAPAPVAADPVAPVTPDPAAPADPSPAPEPADPDPAPDPEPTPKPDKVERRIANLTRKMADEARARQAAEARADAAEALLQAGKPEGAPTTQPPADIEVRAKQIVEEREFNRRLSEIDQAGKKELGADLWEQAKTTLTGLGAVNNQAFLQALAEAENPAKLFAHFADDTDALMDILNKGPAAIGAKIGRLDAQMSKPVARPLSGAPKPAPKVMGSATPPAPTPYDYPPSMSMKDWNAMMDNHLPPQHGGKKRAS